MGGMPLFFVAWMAVIATTAEADSPTVSELLAKYAVNQDRMSSWIIKSEHTVNQRVESYESETIESHDVRFDGQRIATRSHSWGDVYDGGPPVPKDKARYDSRSWDGQRLINHGRADGDPNNSGSAIITSDPPERHIQALQRAHPLAPLMGFCNPGVYDRIDAVISQARSASVRQECDVVNGIACWVIDAVTTTGDYTLWLDPEHAYNVAQVRVRMSAAAGHTRYGRPMDSGEAVYTMTNVRFGHVGDVWLPVEADCALRSTSPRDHYQEQKKHIVVADVVLNPDHEALHSFAHDDIPNGTYVNVYPFVQITYSWQDGELVPRFDKELVTEIERAVEQIRIREQGAQGRPRAAGRSDPPAQARATSSRSLRTHCGLYCLYSLLRLGGRDVKYQDLLKPEYYGSYEGSSLAELRRLAADYGLHAEVIGRLSTRALRSASCQAVLHVRAGNAAREYNHYMLFLGIENGKARLFNPPEAPRLVDFKELACLWDGSALLVSSRPFDADGVCGADRQRLLFCWAVGILVCLVLYVGRLLWSSVVGPVSRRRFARLTVGQGAVLGVAALCAAVVFHLLDQEALLANVAATRSIQKAYQGAFIPRISQNKARRLLKSDAFFIDARLARDYEMAHLGGAMNLPVDANDALWKARTPSIPRNKRIVVYCQSARCKFAENVSVRLIQDGFSNISIYRGGWREWAAQKGQPDGGAKTNAAGKDANGGSAWVRAERSTSKS